MPEHLYDVFDTFATRGPAFELADAPSSGEYDSSIEGVPIARGVTAQAAAELVGLRHPDAADELERHVAEYGSYAIGNFSEDWEVKRSTFDEP